MKYLKFIESIKNEDGQIDIKAGDKLKVTFENDDVYILNKPLRWGIDKTSEGKKFEVIEEENIQNE